MLRRLLGVTLVLGAGGCGPGAPEAPPAPATAPSSAAGPGAATIYFNASVLTGDPAHPRASGVRVEGDRITHVLDGAPPAELEGRRIDLEGAALLPGLVDAHLHLRGLGAFDRQIDLKGTRSADEAAALVRAAAAKAAPGTWIRGRGWDQNDWAVKAFPDRALLDAAAPEHPVWLTRVDGHAAWVSSAAMRLAGVDRSTPAPPGGEILRDAHGEPTGVFVDNAIDLLAGRLPAPTAEELRTDLLRGMERCARVGLTGVHDMGTMPEVLEVLRALEREGLMTLRVTSYLEGAVKGTDALLASPPDREGLLRVVGLKLYADGALGSRGAALLEPYSDRPDTSGLLVTEPAELAARTTRVHAAGWQIAIHAIGDRGIRNALDAIETAEGADRTRRHRIEHAQVVEPGDFARFAALGVVASMQPLHCTSDMPWAEARVGPARIRGAYAWRTMLAAGVPLALGSDAPVEEEAPFGALHAAVTRTDASGAPAGGWYPSERLGLEEAIAGFTRGAAYAAGESDGGVIRPGAVADLTVAAADPSRVTPAELRTMRVLRTIVGGREVFTAGAIATAPAAR